MFCWVVRRGNLSLDSIENVVSALYACCKLARQTIPVNVLLANFRNLRKSSINFRKFNYVILTEFLIELESCYFNVIIYPMGTDCILVSSDEGAGNGPEHPTDLL